MYSWWWVRLSPETFRVKPLRRIKRNCCILLDLFHNSKIGAQHTHKFITFCTNSVFLTPFTTCRWKVGKSKETWRAYRIILSGYQEIILANSSRLVPVLGVLAKLRKAASGSSYLSVRLSACNNSSPTGFSEFIFYIHSSVHRDFILIRSNEMQSCAGVYFLQNYSTWDRKSVV